MKLKELKITDFKQSQKYDFILPIGSTEQHGSFIPFGTDTFITDYLVSRALKEFPEIIVLPTLEYSRSQEHRGFYGTIWLTEETLKAVMYDICNSLKDRAKNIFITSFHANDVVIKKFIKESNFNHINITHLEIFNEEDDAIIEKDILGGVLDGHAGNSEISNMLFIDKKLVKVPLSNTLKNQVSNPFETDNIIEKCPNGIADNNLKWITNSEVGKKILDIYEERIIRNLKRYLQN